MAAAGPSAVVVGVLVTGMLVTGVANSLLQKGQDMARRALALSTGSSCTGLHCQLR